MDLGSVRQNQSVDIAAWRQGAAGRLTHQKATAQTAASIMLGHA